MHLLPISTKLITYQDQLSELIFRNCHLQEHDILVISSKIIAITENQQIKLSSITPSSAAQKFARQTKLTPEFCQLIIEEADQILNAVTGALLTIKNGITIANAGIDQSNAPKGEVILWPKTPQNSIQTLHQQLSKKFNIHNFGLIYNDSRCVPLRNGTTGFALATTGFNPVISEIGQADLYGKTMRITKKAVADMLAAAANLLMGDGAESIPLVIIRDAPIDFIPQTHESMLIDPEKCLYSNIKVD